MFTVLLKFALRTFQFRKRKDHFLALSIIVDYSLPVFKPISYR